MKSTVLRSLPGPSSPRASRRVDRESLAERFLELMPTVRRRMLARFPEDLREELASVTAHQLEALLAIAAEGGITMNCLARSQDISVSSSTALADRLIRQGLADRTSDPTDRRVVRLVPTERALRFVERFRAAKRNSALAALAALDDEELATFVALVTKMAAGADVAEERCD